MSIREATVNDYPRIIAIAPQLTDWFDTDALEWAALRVAPPSA